MNFGQSFRLAIQSLVTSKMRALLTMLGIIIGVAAVIIIVSLGNGMQNMMNQQFEKLGANLIQVQIMGRGTSRTVTPEDMYALAEKYPQYLTGVTPSVGAQAKVRYNGKNYDRTGLTGCSEDYLSLTGGELSKGRFLQYIDVARKQNVCVIGSYLEQEAFRGDALGKSLQIGGVPYQVVGVMAETAESAKGSSDDAIYLPYTNAMRMNSIPEVGAYLFSCTGKDTAAIAKGILETRLQKTFQDENTYFVMTSAEMMDSMNMMVNTMMTVLIAIAAISLLVGGIGIMNIMLVSVTERTREIGIRKSLGGKGRDIRSQFIIEAGTTSAIGGVLGIGLGVSLAGVVGNIIGSTMQGAEGFAAVPSVGAIAIAFGVSVAIGVIFGYLPANKAAKLNPIDALRYD
ncbi:MAG: ABC transporter permease [Pseudoflavonifractor sp.]